MIRSVGPALLCVLACNPGPVPKATGPEATGPEPTESAPTTAASRVRPPPDGFVDLAREIDGIRLDIRYHTPDNFTGAPLPGYGAPGAWLRAPAVAALGRVHADLAEHGLGLLVYDAYRPVRATQAMVAWAERSDRVDVLDQGYVARKSGHNVGHTVDLTLVELASGTPLDMGTAWDTFSTASHPGNATGAALENRRRLAAAMAVHGWEPYAAEWWHFRLPLEPAPAARDVPYGCFEVDEGAWQPPAGWETPGWTAPSTWPSPTEAPCE